MKSTNQLIGCCGLDCEKCDARIATIANDNTLREKTAALWTKLNGVTILPETINCTGCREAGRGRGTRGARRRVGQVLGHGWESPGERDRGSPPDALSHPGRVPSFRAGLCSRAPRLGASNLCAAGKKIARPENEAGCMSDGR